MAKQLISVKRQHNNIAISVDKSATFEEVNVAVSHIAEFTVSRWATKQKCSIAQATEAYLTMVESYIADTHKGNYHDGE